MYRVPEQADSWVATTAASRSCDGLRRRPTECSRPGHRLVGSAAWRSRWPRELRRVPRAWCATMVRLARTRLAVAVVASRSLNEGLGGARTGDGPECASAGCQRRMREPGLESWMRLIAAAQSARRVQMAAPCAAGRSSQLRERRQGLPARTATTLPLAQPGFRSPAVACRGWIDGLGHAARFAAKG